MQHFLWVLGSAAYKTGLIAEKPLLRDVLVLAGDMIDMADADKVWDGAARARCTTDV